MPTSVRCVRVSAKACLPPTNLDGKCSPDEAGVVTKRRNAPARCVLEELKIVEGPPTAWEPGQDLFPPALLLVAVCKVHKSVLEGKLLFGELLQADDDSILGRCLVCAFLNQGRACLLILVVFLDA
jgi:hypothetical protein